MITKKSTNHFGKLYGYFFFKMGTSHIPAWKLSSSYHSCDQGRESGLWETKVKLIMFCCCFVCWSYVCSACKCIYIYIHLPLGNSFPVDSNSHLIQNVLYILILIVFHKYITWKLSLLLHGYNLQYICVVIVDFHIRNIYNQTMKV